MIAVIVALPGGGYLSQLQRGQQVGKRDGLFLVHDAVAQQQFQGGHAPGIAEGVEPLDQPGLGVAAGVPERRVTQHAPVGVDQPPADGQLRRARRRRQFDAQQRRVAILEGLRVQAQRRG